MTKLSARIQAARRVGFVDVKSSAPAAATTWSAICNRERLPDVRILRAKVYAKVTADIIQVGKEWPDAAIKMLRRLLSQWCHRPHVGHNWIHCNRVPAEHATAAAKLLADAAATMTEDVSARRERERAQRSA